MKKKTKKRKSGRRPIIGQQATHMAAVKTTIINPDGTTATPDYQLVSIPKATSYEQYRQELLAHISAGHPGVQVTVEVFDPDHMPKELSGTTFSMVLDDDF